VVLISTILGRFIGYIIRALIARNFGPEVYGFISTSQSLFTALASISLLGFTASLPRQISFHLSKDASGKIKSIIFSGYFISSVVAIIFGLLLVIFSSQVADKV
ncbi:MAG: oligosaccharide flippase family protein, partial [candidate division Zixibacteria bacterium]|nr:oligosaccharide flippase family protein [candidate division Zixibacteria bacterium]NIW39919.1 oligosaccharide flippase family protein [candidate division Zixibacteria bacterium]NIX56772.1 oligosaccharide flippase family protein [candidate division Zixibacteria bacterium]